ncbi:CHASE2 domain-containing protein [Roseicyclus persicicus]|uniref:Adenylate/guanylate cyclase domain-containing protein n=1 Tax=Roseicyclus persicicus TaxID=2650661 RepID=A0A7X6H2S9_9RHOB|nr:adenylate/guanylate cyclase domain-containing protein [Roseibacterium persicicum]NKX46339.1 adenylate/guanylate cyclase domain-containing protein [Roseibacterium persicicum]
MSRRSEPRAPGRAGAGMRRALLLLGLGMTALMLLLAWAAPPVLDRVRDLVFDGYQRASPRPYDPSVPVHIIDIDEAALDLYGQWPWPRSYLAALTDRLVDHGAAAVGYDVLFAEPDRTSPERIVESWSRFAEGIPPALPDLGLPPHDARFAAALAGRPVVLGLAGAAEGEAPVARAGVAVTGRVPDRITRFPAAVGNLPELTAAAAGLGTISLGRTVDGVSRRVPMVTDIGGVLMPAFSAELLRVAQGAGGHVLRTSEASGEVSGGVASAVGMRIGAVEFPVEADAQFRIHFAGQQAARVTPVGEVLAADGIDARLADRIAGRIVLVGSSAEGLFDIRTTPLDGQVAGVVLHAEILEQILSGQFLSRPDWMPGLEVLLVLVAGLVLTVLQWQDRPLRGLVAALALAGGAVLGGLVAFDRAGLLFDPILPVLTVLTVYLPGTTLGLFAKERARRAIRDRFAYFLPPTLIGRIEADPEAALTPGGAERELTILFADMRGFSTVTEGMPPDRVVALVNTWLSALAEALVAHGATIDKFMGDAVMAFWNAPIARADHAAAGLGAIAGLEAAAARANAALAAQGLPPVALGIGVNTGPASVGLMGSRDRLSYTAIGDSVTLAARLEGLTRIYGVPNCVGDATIAALPPDLRAVQLDRIAAKGLSRAAPVHLVLPAATEGLESFAATLEVARAAYLARNWTTAEDRFTDLAQLRVGFCDTPRLAQLYLDRIAGFLRQPPPPDWDGAEQALAKR